MNRVFTGIAVVELIIGIALFFAILNVSKNTESEQDTTQQLNISDYYSYQMNSVEISTQPTTSGPTDPNKLLISFVNSPSLQNLEDVFNPEFVFVEAYKMNSGEYRYVYNVKDSDIEVVVDLDANNATIHSVSNKYGSIYSLVYFQNGVPSNSKELYVTIGENGYSGVYRTDYEAGNKLILYDAENNKIKITL